jgi:collagen triple helix repeat protein
METFPVIRHCVSVLRFRVGAATVAFALGLLAAASTGPSAIAMPPHACNKAAFTGRVDAARPAQCDKTRRTKPHTKGPRGSTGQRGRRGFAGLPGPAGPPGLQGLLAPAGVAGATGLPGAGGAPGADGRPGTPGTNGPEGLAGAPGAQGTPGTRGAEGTPGMPGAEGTAGIPGVEGAAGAPGTEGTPGAEGARGFAGLMGPEGPRGFGGLPGPEGPEGSTGSTGEAGRQGAEGPRGPAGEPGQEGAQGARGAAGPEGPSTPPVYAEFYALMPPDNPATVGAGIPVEFPRSGPSAVGIARMNSTEFVVSTAGTYRVSFSISTDEPGQLVLAVDSGSGMVELPYTVFGRAVGTSLIAGEGLVTTTSANSVLEVRNPSGNTPALTITPKAGGSHAAAASLVIEQLG